MDECKSRFKDSSLQSKTRKKKESKKETDKMKKTKIWKNVTSSNGK